MKNRIKENLNDGVEKPKPEGHLVCIKLERGRVFSEEFKQVVRKSLILSIYQGVSKAVSEAKEGTIYLEPDIDSFNHSRRNIKNIVDAEFASLVEKIVIECSNEARTTHELNDLIKNIIEGEED